MNWIDTLPAIPLAIGLPVTRKDGQRGIIVDLSRMAGDTFNSGIVGVLSEDNAYGTQFWGVNFMRLDLDAPQGFGYALRYACQHCDPSISYLWPAMASRWMRGETTDTDRLALAQAIADVVETTACGDSDSECDQCDRVVSGLTCKRYQCDVCRTEYQECEGSCPRGCEDEEGE